MLITSKDNETIKHIRKMKEKKYTLKDMRSSAQEKLSFDEIVKKLK